MQQRVTRPVREIIQQFVMEMESHPDARLGNCAIDGPCPSNLMFRETSKSQQHLTELRIIYRDVAEDFQEKANKPWKWQGLIDEINAPPPAPVEEKPNPRWAHLLPQKQEAAKETVEAGA